MSVFSSDYVEIDAGPLASQAQSLVEMLELLDDETYAYFLAYGELPATADSWYLPKIDRLTHHLSRHPTNY